jgi:hypothetical protein
MVKEMESKPTLNKHGHTFTIGRPTTKLVSPHADGEWRGVSEQNFVPVRILLGTVRITLIQTLITLPLPEQYFDAKMKHFSVCVHIPSHFSTPTFACSLLVNYITRVR